MGAPSSPSWPRGLPLPHIKDESCSHPEMVSKKVDPESIAVYQSLSNQDPDVDAIYRLTQPLPFDFAVDEQTLMTMVPPQSLSPFNAQATLFTRDALWMLPLPISVHGRVSDIWRSYFGQRLLRETGHVVVFTHPQVIQHRNVHNYLADLESESDLYLKSGRLLEFLMEWQRPTSAKTLPHIIENLYIELYERDYIGIEDVLLVQTWLELLSSVGYAFPALLA